MADDLFDSIHDEYFDDEGDAEEAFRRFSQRLDDWSDAELEKVLDGIDDDPAPVARARRRPRRLTPDAALRTASKAGNVASVTIDNVTFTFGEPGASPPRPEPRHIL
jgi:hypothetical protein